MEEELDLLDTEDIKAGIEIKEELVDKDEERKQLYLSCGNRYSMFFKLFTKPVSYCVFGDSRGYHVSLICRYVLYKVCCKDAKARATIPVGNTIN